MKKFSYLKLGPLGIPIFIYLLFYLIYFNICKNVSACLNGHGDVLSYLMTELTDLKENVFDLVNMKNQTPLHLAAASPSAGKLCLLMYARLWSYYLICKILKYFLILYLICTSIKKNSSRLGPLKLRKGLDTVESLSDEASGNLSTNRNHLISTTLTNLTAVQLLYDMYKSC